MRVGNLTVGNAGSGNDGPVQWREAAAKTLNQLIAKKYRLPVPWDKAGVEFSAQEGTYPRSWDVSVEFSGFPFRNSGDAQGRYGYDRYRQAMEREFYPAFERFLARVMKDAAMRPYQSLTISFSTHEFVPARGWV